MGLGKTMTALALMMFAQKNNQLIVVPKALLDQWRNVIQMRLNHTPLVVHGSKCHKLTVADIANARIVLTTYGMITRRSRPTATHLLLSEQPWGRIIFDEAHHLRNRKTAFLGARALNTEHLWFLTGTPIQNSREDLKAYWTLLGVPATVFVMPGAERQLIDNHILRRTKASLNMDMLEPVTTTIQCGWQDRDEKDISDQFHSSLKCLGRLRETPVRHGVQAFGGQVLAAMVRCRQSCVDADLYLGKLREWEKQRQLPGEEPLPPMQTGSKLQDVCDHILARHQTNLALERRRRLVFCHYLGAMDYIQHVLELQGLSVAQISGKTTMSERQRLTREPVDALILQIRSGCEGLNLQAYADVYLVTPHWNPAVEEQAIGRCHRMGQTMGVQVYRFIMLETGAAGMSMDAYCAKTQEKKRLAAAIIKTRTW
jgi:SNF2 family DNA or RNA helicase